MNKRPTILSIWVFLFTFSMKIRTTGVIVFLRMRSEQSDGTPEMFRYVYLLHLEKRMLNTTPSSRISTESQLKTLLARCSLIG